MLYHSTWLTLSLLAHELKCPLRLRCTHSTEISLILLCLLPHSEWKQKVPVQSLNKALLSPDYQRPHQESWIWVSHLGTHWSKMCLLLSRSSQILYPGPGRLKATTSRKFPSPFPEFTAPYACLSICPCFPGRLRASFLPHHSIFSMLCPFSLKWNS